MPSTPSTNQLDEGALPLVLPPWNELSLRMQVGLLGQTLDFHLFVAGNLVAKAQAWISGELLIDPSTPSWARCLLEEAAQEWARLHPRPDNKPSATEDLP